MKGSETMNDYELLVRKHIKFQRQIYYQYIDEIKRDIKNLDKNEPYYKQNKKLKHSDIVYNEGRIDALRALIEFLDIISEG